VVCLPVFGLGPEPCNSNSNSILPVLCCVCVWSQVLSYMRPKMHAVLLDATINSALTTRLNIYQVDPEGGHWREGQGGVTLRRTRQMEGGRGGERGMRRGG